MIYKLWQTALILFGVGLVGLTWPGRPVAGQTPEPALTNLMVELWPEYDRPEVLVIYQVELSPTTPMPAEVTFPLPGYVDEMFVVAVEQSGGLFEAPPDTYFLSQAGDQALFTISTPTRRFQFEYYDPEILQRQADSRTLTFELSAPYATSRAMFQVQEPVGSSDFNLTPAAESSFIGQDGLNYSRVEQTDLAPAESFSLIATYRRNTDNLTIQSRSAETTNQAGPPAGVSEAATAAATADSNLTLGYVLIGIGSLLFLAAGGSWWWTRRHRTAARSARRRKPAGSRPKRSASPKQPRQQPPPTAAFCYKCGTALRAAAKFCHSCGAERR